jgi:acetyl esterase/lipase
MQTPKRKSGRRRRWWIGLVGLIWLGLYGATTDNIHVWPVRNTALYHLSHWWAARFGPSVASGSGSLSGCVRSTAGAPIAAAGVLVSEPDGAVHQAATGSDGCYRLDSLPAGRYVPLISAIGYRDLLIEPLGLPLHIAAGEAARADATLAPILPVALDLPTKFALGEPATLTVDIPRPSSATRRQLVVMSAAGVNQTTYVYTPITATAPLPTLLAVYPGTADEWESVSVPLAAAGYAVVAVGPVYSLDLEADIAELRRLLALLRAGAVPQVDASRLAILGGSYSSLHVQRLLRDDPGFRGVVLLGPISDLFDLRQRFEAGTFFPPYGLDQALIALGWPNTAMQNYAPYSAVYHLRPDQPPLLLLHSRADEIVPTAQSERLAGELERLGVPVEAHFFDGMAHYLYTDRPSAQLDELYALTLDFLGRRLAE